MKNINRILTNKQMVKFIKKKMEEATVKKLTKKIYFNVFNWLRKN